MREQNEHDNVGGGIGGFVTLEAMVAFSILTVALVIFYQSIAGNFRAAATINEYDDALAHANSYLQSAGVTEPLREGRSTGTFSRELIWVSEISVMSAPKRVDGKETIPRYWVNLKVSKTNGKELLELETVVFAEPIAN